MYHLLLLLLLFVLAGAVRASAAAVGWLLPLEKGRRRFRAAVGR
jgi:hypothetical protein